MKIPFVNLNKDAAIYVLTIVAAILLSAFVAFFLLIADLPHVPDDLRNLVYSQPTEIYAADGSLVHRLSGRTYVSLDQISPHFQRAVIAAEDGDFYSHHGIDKVAVLRAALFNLLGRTRGSGSTITQQLTKNLFFSFERQWSRKFKEMLLSFQLETSFSKEQILEAYCNVIHFGGSAQGIEDASRQFFDKPAAALDLAEASLLAGIINAPNRLNPFSHFEAAKARQQVVLQRMRNEGFITEEEQSLATTTPLLLTSAPSQGNDFVDYVLAEAEKRFGAEAVHFGGLRIYTTLDPALQALAEKEVESGLTKLEAELDTTGHARLSQSPNDTRLQGALVAISVATGEVKALVGGRQHIPGGFNRAVAENRHVGSAIKPFVYYTALEQLQMSPVSIVNDTVTSLRLPNRTRWTPRNFDRRHRGRMTLKYALMRSINAISAQLISRVTPQKVIETIRKFGITSKIEEVPSVALGTAGISPLQMAAAFAMFANDGVYYKPIFIKRVEDANGVILDRAFVLGEGRLLAATTFEVLDMMRGVIDGGTARGIRSLGFNAPAAGKTGTSTEFTDAWFTGFTTSLSTSVWVGYDRVFQMYTRRGRGVDGARGAAPIWANFMKQATLVYPAREFTLPEGLKMLDVDPISGKQVSDPAEGIPVAVPLDVTPDFLPFWERRAIPVDDDSTDAQG
jgi:penicillin-binding protein 1A